MILKIKHWIYNWLFNYLTKPVILEQIITIDNVGRVKIDGKIITPNELRDLQEQVRALQTMRLKTILFTLPKALAQDKMFTSAQNWDDMLIGKMMLYNVSVQENAMLAILTAPDGNQPIAVQQNPYRP